MSDINDTIRKFVGPSSLYAHNGLKIEPSPLVKDETSVPVPEPGTPNQVFTTGAQRGTDVNGVRYDLLSPIALRRWAEAYAEGSGKYGDYNCEKGFPIHDILNHALRHIFMYLNRDDTEDHLGHAMWNIAMAMHTEERRPEMRYGLRPLWAVLPGNSLTPEQEELLKYVDNPTPPPRTA